MEINFDIFDKCNLEDKEPTVLTPDYIAPTSTCPLHSEERLEYFCQSCGRHVCCECIIAGQHNGHDVTLQKFTQPEPKKDKKRLISRQVNPSHALLSAPITKHAIVAEFRKLENALAEKKAALLRQLETQNAVALAETQTKSHTAPCVIDVDEALVAIKTIRCNVKPSEDGSGRKPEEVKCENRLLRPRKRKLYTVEDVTYFQKLEKGKKFNRKLFELEKGPPRSDRFARCLACHKAITKARGYWKSVRGDIFVFCSECYTKGVLSELPCVYDGNHIVMKNFGEDIRYCALCEQWKCKDLLTICLNCKKHFCYDCINAVLCIN